MRCGLDVHAEYSDSNDSNTKTAVSLSFPSQWGTARRLIAISRQNRQWLTESLEVARVVEIIDAHPDYQAAGALYAQWTALETHKDDLAMARIELARSEDGVKRAETSLKSMYSHMDAAQERLAELEALPTDPVTVPELKVLEV